MRPPKYRHTGTGVDGEVTEQIIRTVTSVTGTASNDVTPMVMRRVVMRGVDSSPGNG